MKVYGYFFRIAMGVFILSLSGCVYYKTLKIQQPSKIDLEQVAATKSIVLLNNHYSTASYRLNDLIIKDSIFSANATFTTGLHDPDQKSFKRVKKEQRLTKIEPTITFHINLKTDTQIEEGYFEAEIASIESISIHKKNPGKSAGIVLIPIGVIAIMIAFIGIAISFPLYQ
jgi:hypothetical protein